MCADTNEQRTVSSRVFSSPTGIIIYKPIAYVVY